MNMNEIYLCRSWLQRMQCGGQACSSLYAWPPPTPGQPCTATEADPQMHLSVKQSKDVSKVTAGTFQPHLINNIKRKSHHYLNSAHNEGPPPPPPPTPTPHLCPLTLNNYTHGNFATGKTRDRSVT